MVLSHGVTAVGYHAAHGEILGQVLHGLGLSGARRPGRRASQKELHGRREGHDAPVGQWRDDQSVFQALLLVALLVVPCALLDLDDFGFIVKVKTQLRLPLEFFAVQDRVAHEVSHNVSGVHSTDDHDVNFDSVTLGLIWISE